MASARRRALLAAALTTVAPSACGDGTPSTTPSTTPPTTGAPAAPADPARVIAAVDAFAAASGEAPATCFGRAPATGAILCAVEVTSIQGGSTRAVRVLGPGAADIVVYQHPDGDQYFEDVPEGRDAAGAARARTLVETGGFGWWEPVATELAPGATIEVGGHTLRRTRTEAGTDGDPETGEWIVYTDVTELRCGDRWVPLDVAADTTALSAGQATIAVHAGDAGLLITTEGSWGIEGDHGTVRDAVLVDPAATCR